MRTSLKIISLFLTGLLMVACEQDGPAERAGEAIDDTVDELSDAGNDVGDSFKDAGDEVADAIDDACEKVKEGVNAKDQDC